MAGRQQLMMMRLNEVKMMRVLTKYATTLVLYDDDDYIIKTILRNTSTLIDALNTCRTIL